MLWPRRVEAIQLIELPNFREGLEELEKPLDLWLYYLQNGDELDADALLGSLDIPEIRWAMGVLKLLCRTTWRGSCLKAGERQTRSADPENAAHQSQQRYLEAQHRLDVVSREHEEARRNDAKRGFAERIRLSQRLLKRPLDDVEDLAGPALTSCATSSTAGSGI